MTCANAPETVAGACGVGLVVGHTLISQHIAVVINARGHGAQAQGDVLHRFEFCDGGVDPVGDGLAVNFAPVYGSAATPGRGLFDQQNLLAGLGSHFSGLQTCHAASDDGNVREVIEMLIGVGVFGFRVRGFAETGGLAHERFIDVFPEGARVHEHFVVKASGQEAGEQRVDRADVKFQRRPVVLACGVEAAEQLGRGGPLVGFEFGTLTHVEKRIGLFGARGDNTARAVVFERPADHHLVIGQQSRRQSVALKAFEALAVEAEFNRFRFI